MTQQMSVRCEGAIRYRKLVLSKTRLRRGVKFEVEVDVGRAMVCNRRHGGKWVPLTADEITVLSRLHRARGQLVPASELERVLYDQPGREREVGEVKYHIRNLRRKLSDTNKALICCRRNLGYRLNIELVNWR